MSNTRVHSGPALWIIASMPALLAATLLIGAPPHLRSDQLAGVAFCALLAIGLYGLAASTFVEWDERSFGWRSGFQSWRIPCAEISGYELYTPLQRLARNGEGLRIFTYGGGVRGIRDKTFTRRAVARIAAGLDEIVARNLA